MFDFNILVLHRMGDPLLRREAVRSLEYMIPQCRADLNCIVHDADIPVPDYIKEIEYHLIVLGPTFLCARYHPSLLAKTFAEFSFVKDSRACKIALPQDDYDCSAILDDWMINWNINCIFTVCPSHWDVLYPRSINCIELRQGYTGYIADTWIQAWNHPKSHASRTVDVSYRATKLPANFGRIGQLKGLISDRFKLACSSYSDLNLDISTEPSHFIPRDRWHTFMNNSKFCLATPSGSSLLDPHGYISSCVHQYTSLHPNSDFNEIEKHCFPAQDGKYSFQAISPRNIEAALAETVQIATHGSYSGILQPHEHYILLAEDCSNVEDVIRKMKDSSYVATLRKRCKESLLSEPRLRQRIIVNEIINIAENYSSRFNIVVRDQHKVNKLFERYQAEIGAVSASFWRRKRFEQKLKSSASRLRISRHRDFFVKVKEVFLNEFPF